MDNEILARKSTFTKGSRVEVVEFINDPYRPLKVGSQGTVIRVDGETICGCVILCTLETKC